MDSFATVWRFPDTPTAGSTRKVGLTSYLLSLELLRDGLSRFGARGRPDAAKRMSALRYPIVRSALDSAVRYFDSH